MLLVQGHSYPYERHNFNDILYFCFSLMYFSLVQNDLFLDFSVTTFSEGQTKQSQRLMEIDAKLGDDDVGKLGKKDSDKLVILID